MIQQKSKAEENKSIFVKNRNMIHISAWWSQILRDRTVCVCFNAGSEADEWTCPDAVDKAVMHNIYEKHHHYFLQETAVNDSNFILYI